MNHSFSANLSEWFCEHPRFGVIPCERATRDIAAGEELFLDYEYDPYNCPEWFRDALFAFLDEAGPEARDRLGPKYAKFVEIEYEGSRGDAKKL